MSIVNQTTLQRLRDFHHRAHNSESYNLGYRLAMEGLSAAIAQLEQVDRLTEGYTIKVEKA